MGRSTGRSRVSSILALLLLAILSLMPLSCIGQAGPLAELADYGDAPDDSPAYDNPSVTGRFPSFYNTTNTIPPRRGPFAQIVDEVWLSANGNATSSTTTVEEDALTVDLDFDDAYPLYGLDPYTAQAVLRVRVASSTLATRDLWYLNVVMDLDRDGRWIGTGTLREWVGRNIPVELNPGEARLVLIPFQALHDGTVWTRLAVTDSQIDQNIFGEAGWDGSGPENGFTRGEIEDWLLAPYWRSPEPIPPGVPDPDPDPVPNPNPRPLSPPPPSDFKDFDIYYAGATWNSVFRWFCIAEFCKVYTFNITIKNRGTLPVTMFPGDILDPPPPGYGVMPDAWGTNIPPGGVVIPRGESYTFEFWIHEFDPPPPDLGLGVRGYVFITPDPPGDLTLWGAELAWWVPVNGGES